MDDSSYPLGLDVWRRGAQLGLRWLAVFFATTAVLYLLLGFIGWSGIGRALCALFTGPVIGTLFIVLWYIARRPTLIAEHYDQSGDEEQTE